MNVKATVKVGETVFQIEPTEGKVKDMFYEIVEFATELEKTPTVCDVCKSTNVVWRTTKTKEKGYKYIKRFCLDCKSAATMGERNEDGMLYWRRNEKGGLWVKYIPEDETPTNKSVKKENTSNKTSVSSEDIPF